MVFGPRVPLRSTHGLRSCAASRLNGSTVQPSAISAVSEVRPFTIRTQQPRKRRNHSNCARWKPFSRRKTAIPRRPNPPSAHRSPRRRTGRFAPTPRPGLALDGFRTQGSASLHPWATILRRFAAQPLNGTATQPLNGSMEKRLNRSTAQTLNRSTEKPTVLN